MDPGLVSSCGLRCSQEVNRGSAFRALTLAPLSHSDR